MNTRDAIDFFLEDYSIRSWSAHNSYLANMGGGIVDPQIITQFSDQLLSVLGRPSLNIHPQELTGPNIRHLRVASLQDQIVMDRLTLGITSKRLVLNDHFDSIRRRTHRNQTVRRLP